MRDPSGMQLDFEWIGVPDSGDPLESRTWARLAWRLGTSTLTRALDRKARSVRENVYVPLYPLADWIVSHWWSLLYEPWPMDGPLPGPETEADLDVQGWLRRHCIRVANPGFAGPFACIFSQGPNIAVVCRPDPRGRYPGVPVEFIEDVEGTISREDVRDALGEFVEGVLQKLSDCDDERVADLRTDWQAIRDASLEEAEFCRAAGRLGLDPYDPEAWPEPVLKWFERSPPGKLDSAFLIDLLESPDPTIVKPGQCEALVQLADLLALTGAAKDFGPHEGPGTAFTVGYTLARWVRDQMGLVPGQPIQDLREAAEAACGRGLDVNETAAIPEGHVLSVVGWNANAVPVLATRSDRGRRDSAKRFLWGRGLYLVLRGAARGPRLVTDAKTWDQRVSRAFAAELLAPRDHVKHLYLDIEARAGRDEADATLAELYNVSPMVIRHQVENLRVRVYG